MHNAPPLKLVSIIQERSSLFDLPPVVSSPIPLGQNLFLKLKLHDRRNSPHLLQKSPLMVGRNNRISRTAISNFGKSNIRARISTFSFILTIWSLVFPRCSPFPPFLLPFGFSLYLPDFAKKTGQSILKWEVSPHSQHANSPPRAKYFHTLFVTNY